MATNNAINLSAAGIVTYDGVGTFSGSIVLEHSTLLAGPNNTVVDLGVAANGQLVIGNTGNAPSLATLTAGSGIAISNGPGAIEISSTAAGFAWNVVAGTTQAIDVLNGYITKNAALTTFTLPASAAIGDRFSLVSDAGLFTIAQNAGQQVKIGKLSTTVGVGGSISNTFVNDTLEILCTTADTEFTVLNMVGNFTVV